MQFNEDESDLTLVQIAGQLYGPKLLALDDDTNEQRYLVRAIVEPQDGRYEITTIEFSQTDDGPPVQRGQIVQIPIEAFIHYAAAEAVLFIPLHWRSNPTSILEEEAPDGTMKGRARHTDLVQMLHDLKGSTPSTDDDYQRIAGLYRWLRSAEGKPTTAMATALDKSPATVRRWLAKAVKLGYLTDSERVR